MNYNQRQSKLVEKYAKILKLKNVFYYIEVSMIVAIMMLILSSVGYYLSVYHLPVSEEYITYTTIAISAILTALLYSHSKTWIEDFTSDLMHPFYIFCEKREANAKFEFTAEAYRSGRLKEYLRTTENRKVNYKIHNNTKKKK